MLFHHSYKVTQFEWADIETLRLAIIGFFFQTVLCVLSGQVDGKLLSVIGSMVVTGLLGLLPGMSVELQLMMPSEHLCNHCEIENSFYKRWLLTQSRLSQKGRPTNIPAKI